MKKILAILILLLGNLTIYCQSVGLVLSGGGAKGLAHIGVIKALEENEIPINYIAGTSMGAIVGGLYAIGYSPEEMVKIFKSSDFKYWSTGVSNDEFKFVFNETINDAALVSFEVKVDSNLFKPVFPSNIIPTQQMDLAFLKIFAQGSAVSKNNFDSLFIPFRCIASDIQNKKQVIFRSGDLGEAIRASMTIPLYFKPLIISNKMLFDGGIYNNFPWKELKNEFSVNYIIGSKVANNSKPPKEDDVLLQLENMIVGQTDYNIPDSLGIVLETDLKEIEILDFNKIDYIVNCGYLNTLKYIEEIKSKVKIKLTNNELMQRRTTFKTKAPKLEFKNLEVNGVNEKQKRYILNSITKKTKVFTIDKVEEEYHRLISDEFVKRIYPIAMYNYNNKSFYLSVKADIKKNLDISIGGNVSSSSINQGFVSSAYSFIGNSANKIYANIYFGRLYSSINLSYKKKIPFKIPIAITTSLILSRTDYYRSSNELFFEDVKPSFLIKNDAFGYIELSTPLSKSTLFSINNSFGSTIDEYYQKDNFTKNDTPDKTYFTFSNSSFKIEKRTLNKKIYAYKGRNIYFKVNYIYGKEENVPGTTGKLKTDTSIYHQWFNVKVYNESYHRIIKNSFWLGILIEANYSNKPFFSNYSASILSSNSFTPNPQSKTIFIKDFRTDRYFAVGLVPNIKIYGDLYFRFEGYIFKPINQILDIENEAKYEDFNKRFKFFGSAGLILHTPVGPLSFNFHYYPKEVKEYYLIFNFGLLIFNKKGLE